MTGLELTGCGGLGFGVVFLLVPFILKICRRLDLRRAGDLHHAQPAALPRFGGAALAIALLAVESLVATCFPELCAGVSPRSAVLLGSLAMFAVGFWDDLQPLGARRKLAAQVLISLAVCFAGLQIENFKLPFSTRIVPLHALGPLVTVLWLVGITNLINLIDGIDGLAGGIALMLMGLLVYVGCQNGGFVYLASGMTGALLAFLYFNFPPARIYLGDGGAYLIGFQLGAFSIASSQKGSIFAALIAPLFVLALPIVDTTLAILRRGLRGLPLFRPDRRHIHHHLLGMGFSRRQVVLSCYSLTLLFLGMGLVALWSRGQLVPVLAGLALVVLLLCAGRLRFSREWFAVGRTLGNSLAMRQEIQYALCLTDWLKLEGRRCNSLEDLFGDFVCAAGRLGFSSVKLRLPDGERSWEQPCSCRNLRRFHQDLPGGLAGSLELCAPSCLSAISCPLPEPGAGNAEPGACPHQDQARFEIMAELVAESWVKALLQMETGRTRSRVNSTSAPARFSLRRPGRRPFAARSPASVAREPLGFSDDSAVVS